MTLKKSEKFLAKDKLISFLKSESKNTADDYLDMN